ncbi:MAG: ECF transporter S component [Ruminococcaceae bacterium]|nr:ECF transporter S component [Oscillospiraceae bacterium]
MKKTNILNLVQLALFAALIFLMAFTPFIGYIPLGFTRATIIHVPVIIGSIMLGPVRGGFLGFLFGLTSLINNTINPTATSFVFSPFYSLGEVSGNLLSLVICFVPRILVGVLPHYIYKWLKKPLGQSTSLILAGLGGSLTNTLLVMHMILLFFGRQYAAANKTAYEAIYMFILSIIGINGVPEAIVAAFLTLVICKALMAVEKKRSY